MTKDIILKNIEKHKTLLSAFETYAPEILLAMAGLIADTFEKEDSCIYVEMVAQHPTPSMWPENSLAVSVLKDDRCQPLP
jgi:predicted choloylglycine hydrolase